MRDSLLWVYEGQTQYWGFVLAARSGLWTKEQARDALAVTAAPTTTTAPGRAWRNVEDTTNDPIIAARRPLPWTQLAAQRGLLFSEGQLIWLDVDTLICASVRAASVRSTISRARSSASTTAAGASPTRSTTSSRR